MSECQPNGWGGFGTGRFNQRHSPKSKKHCIVYYHQSIHFNIIIQIETLASDLGLQIAGYYVACEQFHDNSIEKAPGIRIADKIAENNPNACFAIVS